MFNSDLLKNGLLGELGGLFKRAPAAVSEGRGMLPVLGGAVAFAADLFGSAAEAATKFYADEQAESTAMPGQWETWDPMWSTYWDDK